MMANDPVIRADRLTGRLLHPLEYSTSYLSWLGSDVPVIKMRPPLPRVPIDRFQYSRMDATAVPAFTGGVKPSSTASVLLGIAARARIDDGGWDLTFYEGDDVLTTTSGGEHRTLAHSLWGDDHPQASLLTVYSSQRRMDSELNQALLKLEGLLDRNFHISSQQEADQVKRLALDSTPEELVAFGRGEPPRRRSWFAQMVSMISSPRKR
jgi:hypothetical protein